MVLSLAVGACASMRLGIARLHYSPTHKATTNLLKIAIDDDDTGKNTHRYCITTVKMRTYDDTFSGQKIYPGKVRCHFHLSPPYNPSAMLRQLLRRLADRMRMEDIWTRADEVIFEIQGKLYIRGDSKIFRFQNGKTESLFLQRKNPRRIAWTTLFRRQHKKGISEVSRTGASIPDICCTIGGGHSRMQQESGSHFDAKMTTHSKSVEDGTNADISLYLSTRDITHVCT